MKNKSKLIDGLKSRPIKYLKHPLERSLSIFCIITIFFTLLAIITGIPIIIFLTLILIPTILIKKLSSSTSFKILRFNDNSESKIQLTPIESYWLNENDKQQIIDSNINDISNENKSNSNSNISVNNNSNSINNVNININNTNNNSDNNLTKNEYDTNHKQGICTCLLYLDKGLSIEQLRDVFMTRLIQKPKMSKFRSILTYKGFFKVPFWKRLTFEQFSIEEQIIEDTDIKNKNELKAKLIKLMSMKLNMNLPLWQIRWCYASYLNQIILIIRIHQSLVDGMDCMRILIDHLADQCTPLMTTFIKTSSGTTTTTTGYFKPRFGGVNFTLNLFRAFIVGPLTFLLWIIWAFSRRKNNFLYSRDDDFLNKKKFDKKIFHNENTDNEDDNDENTTNKLNENQVNLIENYDVIKSIYWSSIELPKIIRIKQVTRSSFNDIIVSSLSGAIRKYLTKKCLVLNPPDIGISIPIDIKNINDYDLDDVGVNYVLINSPLPTNTEGAIPCLWEVRHFMEEMKTSADSAVMYGAHYFLQTLLPSSIAKYCLNLAHRNSSVCLSNLQGPITELTIGSHRLRKIHFWMSPPSNISMTINLLTYNQRLYISILCNSKLISNAKYLTKLFKKQLLQLNSQLARRRVPGETRHRRKGEHYLIDKPLENSVPKLLQSLDLTAKLNDVQAELFQLNETLENSPAQKIEVSTRLEELKDEFSMLLKEIRRRKSIVDYGHAYPMINIEKELNQEEEEFDDDDDIDGELRPDARRLSFTSRRSSFVPALPLPTTTRFPLTSPLIGRHEINSHFEDYESFQGSRV